MVDKRNPTPDNPFVTPLKIDPKLIANDTPIPDKITTPHLSYSQLAMYLRCSMQYKFRYVLGLKDRPNVATSIGKGGHAALEWNAKKKIITGEDRPVDDLIDMASDQMDRQLAELDESDKKKSDEDVGTLKDRQLSATKVFRLRDAPAITPIGAEVEYNLDINPYIPDAIRQAMSEPARPVNMKLDVIYLDRNTHVQNHDEGIAIGIEDYKYVTRKKPQIEINLSPQLTTYIVGMKALTGKWATKLGIRMMHPGSLAKNPRGTSEVPDSLVVLREPEHMTPEALTARMRRIAYQFAQAENGIRNQVFIPVDEPQTCAWCGYRDRCQGTSLSDFDAAKIRSGA